MAGAWALLPPALAIVAAVTTRRVHASLLLGLLSAGALAAWPGTSGPMRPLAATTGAFVQTVTWTIGVVAARDSAAILVFLFLLGGLVAVLQRSGAMRAFGERALRHASDRRRAQTLAWLVGTTILAVDDHFNVVAAGTLLRPVTDRVRLSREKLAYLVDSTASPVAIINPIGTWAGFMGVFAAGALAAAGVTVSGYALFLRSIPLNLYAWATLAFVLGVALSGRDLGPMRRAEQRAADGDLEAADARPLATGLEEAGEDGARPRDLVLPLAFLAVAALAMLWATGRTPGSGIRAAITQADAPVALAAATALTLLFAFSRARLQGRLRGDRFLDAVLDGGKALVPALSVLVLALALGGAVQDLGLGGFVASALADGMPIAWLPLAAFLASALVALATGTSFGTYAVMFPVTLGIAAAHPDGAAWYPAVVAATAGGGVFGDHASPVSDTTILSSMAAQCDHVHHVRTQAPYALLSAGACATGLAALALGAPAWAVTPAVTLAAFLLPWTGTRPLAGPVPHGPMRPVHNA